MKYILLADKNNPEHTIKFNIPISDYAGGTAGSEWESFADYHVSLDWIYNVFGVDAAFQTLWRLPFTEPSTPHDIATWNVISTLLPRMRQFSTSPSSPGEDVSGTLWYIADKAPEERRYVKWNNSAVVTQYTVYDTDGVTVLSSNVFGGPVLGDVKGVMPYSAITNISEFLASDSASSSRNHAIYGNFTFEGGSSTTPDNRAQVFRRTSDFDWIWWLSQGVDPTTESDNDPYAGDDAPYDPSGPGGGGGERPPYDEGDDIPYPNNPPVSICDTGLISLYTPSATQLNLLAADLWSSNFVSSLVKDIYADPIDVIISVGIVPFNVTPTGTKKIKVGERELDISSNYPASNYVNFDMGSVALKEALGAYTDFAPYTKGNIYIPFVGFCPLDVDFFMGHNIGLKYKVDLCTGSAVAYLMRDDSVHQQFACNLKITIPLSGADYSSMWSTIISATAALATAGAAGLAGATAAGEAAEGGGAARALQAGGKSASDIMTGMSTKPQIQKSNSMPNTGGLVGYPCAFIVLEHPALAIPANQNKFIGYPSYINSKLSSLTGYTRVSSIHLGIAEATKRELVDIENSLKSGVIIQGGGAATATGIGLMTTDDPANVIGKKMTLVADLVGHFRAEVDIVNPVVTIERSSAVGFNYVYIADFGRYYFVDEVRAVRNNVLELHLSCDPLESFRSAILAHDAIIDKQEKQWNLYLNDDSIKMYQYPLIWRKLFENAFWDDFEYVLITAGA